ncbi:phage NrS-1 polymerase family protein [Natrinema sp. LN54]|uniref:phage NrS-1 polymerase family protein n=1 Tax=Natrinema sp. LN54 TaxID=3458705 RepID=UPI0040350F29
MSEQTVSVLPEQLRERDQWVCWREESRDGKPTKIPVTPMSGEFASSTDPETWASVETALEYADSGDANGIGFVFTDDDPIVGVDLDDCRDPETETVEDAAQDIIERLDSYTEISPSGTGFHVLIEGELPDGRNRRGNIELYDIARFFTVTGDTLEESPSRVARRQDALEAIHREYVQDSESDGASESGYRGVTDEQASTGTAVDTNVDLEDEELLEKARNASNGSKFERLWNGNTAGYESQSEADMALCCLLAFWTGGNHTRVDTLFRQSGLLREKWDDVHYADGSTYGEKTIERAITSTSEFYDPDARDNSSDANSRQSESSTAGSRDEPAENHAYLVEKNRLLTDRVDDLETTLEEKDERIADLEATNEALREQLRDCQETLERRDQASNPEMDEASANKGDSIWGRAKQFVGDGD